MFVPMAVLKWVRVRVRCAGRAPASAPQLGVNVPMAAMSEVVAGSALAGSGDGSAPMPSSYTAPSGVPPPNRLHSGSACALAPRSGPRPQQ